MHKVTKSVHKLSYEASSANKKQQAEICGENVENTWKMTQAKWATNEKL